MPSAPLPSNEPERLAALRDLEILDSATEPQFDALVHAASAIADTPISLVSLVDEDRQWFKAGMGLGDVRQTDRCDAFCAHTILQSGAMEIQDTLLDERFATNALVLGEPKIRFYCGVAIHLTCGSRVGTLCVIDQVPRAMTQTQLDTLAHLAMVTASALEGRKASLDLIRQTSALRSSESSLARANLSLQHANEDLRSFVHVASHDLKAPLVTIQRLVDWAREALEEGDPEAASGHLDLLNRRAARMETLLSDLRQLATLGRRAVKLETIDSWALVERTFQWHEGNKEVQLELDGERTEITTQVAPLEIVLRNLIGNAIKHREDTEPTITVTTCPHPSGESITVTVADDGPGIEPQFHESVFEPFKTLQSRDKTEGSGLGLAIVKRTVELSGGSISVESDGVSGTSFRLVWPLNRLASLSNE